MAKENHAFQAEVSRLLEIVAHSLYSNRDIFLRELISNASDACDKLRYAALTDGSLLGGDSDLAIHIAADDSAGTVTVSDNGIGMSRDELVGNLGTIARSGTAAFVARTEEAARQAEGGGHDSGLIGQFGVGFYAAFMVADRVRVLSRKAGDATGHCWESDGKGGFSVGEDDTAPARGTRVVLHITKGQEEFLEKARLRHIVKSYSDHIAVPIFLLEGGKQNQINEGSALWVKAKQDITTDQYTAFYRHNGHMADEPWMVIHNRNEGVLEYTNLLFIPSSRPFDLFHPERHNRVKLYVRRVFITDDCAGLLPAWLRFLRGVVDSGDLPLNISREMLQHNPVLAKMRTGLVKRVMGELKKKAEKDPQAYATFWEAFGAVLKEGLYEDSGQQEALLQLARFRSSSHDGWVSLQDYVGRMVDGQKDIFYIAGEDADSLARAPQLEGFRARGVEVLLFTDPVDEFWLQSVSDHDGKKLVSVTRGDMDLASMGKTPEPEPDTAELAGLIALLKVTLGDAVKDVRRSRRLTDSAVCLVADDGDMDMHLARILQQHNQVRHTAPRILELNPKHSLIQGLEAGMAAKGEGALPPDMVTDLAFLLLDQARVAEGEPVADPAAFARRLSAVMERGLNPAPHREASPG